MRKLKEEFATVRRRFTLTMTTNHCVEKESCARVVRVLRTFKGSF